MLPKKGSFFLSQDQYAKGISAALRAELGPTHQAVKVLMRWTHVSEKTAKNWMTGKTGPRGEHLAALISHSDQMMNVYLTMAGRRPVTVLLALPLLRNHLLELADEIDACVSEISNRDIR